MRFIVVSQMCVCWVKSYQWQIICCIIIIVFINKKGNFESDQFSKIVQLKTEVGTGLKIFKPEA